MTAHHTPQPWFINDQGGHSVLIQAATDSACNINPVDGEAYTIAEVFNAGPENGQEECRYEAHANARLMVTAPKLLALVRVIADFGEPSPDTLTYISAEFIRKCRAAVAEAAAINWRAE